ncbi:transposase [Streptomyces sp. DSM 40167]|nr:transposase [Streptomyces sp. DSM 40167]
MTRHRPYPSDLSDARWELIGPTLTAWRADRRGKGLDIGRPPDHDLRRIMNAILYVDRTGIPWRYLSHAFAPWEAVYGYFATWQKEGVFDQLNGLLRRLARRAEGRDGEPSACVLDAPSVMTFSNKRPARESTPARKSQAASAISG